MKTLKVSLIKNVSYFQACKLTSLHMRNTLFTGCKLASLQGVNTLFTPRTLANVQISLLGLNV